MFSQECKVLHISNRVINVWNSLPDYVVNADSLTSFKNLLDEQWVDYHYNAGLICMYLSRIHRLCLFPEINTNSLHFYKQS